MNQSGNVASPNIRGDTAISTSAKAAADCRLTGPQFAKNGENDAGELGGRWNGRAV
jgi:hypothetical protein